MSPMDALFGFTVGLALALVVGLAVAVLVALVHGGRR